MNKKTIITLVIVIVVSVTVMTLVTFLYSNYFQDNSYVFDINSPNFKFAMFDSNSLNSNSKETEKENFLEIISNKFLENKDDEKIKRFTISKENSNKISKENSKEIFNNNGFTIHKINAHHGFKINKNISDIDFIYYFPEKWNIEDNWLINDTEIDKYYIPEGFIKINKGAIFKIEKLKLNSDPGLKKEFFIIYKN